jgi:glycine oxidase ThiO
MAFDITVIGGGVIGLSCAWKLARAGARVQLLERGALPGEEASWAAAGLIAAHGQIGGHSADATHGPKPVLTASETALRDLCLHSRSLYEEFAREVEAESGVDVGLCLNSPRPGDTIQPGIVHIAAGDVYFDSDEGIEEITQERARQLSGVELHAPGSRFFWLANEGQVESRALLQALLVAAQKAGVEVRAATPVTGFDVADGRISSIHAQGEKLPCERILWATGAWAGQSKGLSSQCLPPVSPLAGQVMALRPRQLPRCIIYYGGVYMVPRRSGQLVLGATSDDTGFDKPITPAGGAQLFESAKALIPSLAQSSIEGQWCGLRPATPDGLPVMGATPLPNFTLATGHFRNGILLAPVTAQMLTRHLLEGAQIPSAFELARFGGE